MSPLITLVKKAFSVHLWQMWMPTILDFVVKQKGKPNGEKRLFLFCKAVLYAWCLLITARIYLGALVLSRGRDHFAWYLPFDPIVDRFSAMLPFFDPYILLAGSFSPLYNVKVDYAIYFQLDQHSNGFFHDYACKNGEHFWQLNGDVLLHTVDSSSRFASKVIRIIAGCRRIWTGQVEERRLRFAHQHLRYVSRHVSRGLRAKAVLLTLLLSLNIVFSCILFFFIYFFAAFFVYRQIQPHFSGRPLALLVCTFELAMMVYAAWNANRLGALGLHYAVTPQLVTCEHMGRLEEQLAGAMRPWAHQDLGSSSSNSSSSTGSGSGRRSSYVYSLHSDLSPRQQKSSSINSAAVLNLCAVLEHFRSEHATALRHMAHINQNAASGFLAAAAVSQLPINLWMVSSLLFKRQSRGEQAVMFALIAVQLYLGGAARSVLVRWAAALYRPGTLRHLVRAQVQALVWSPAEKKVMPANRKAFLFTYQGYGALVKAKLKLAAYIELLHTEAQFCFTLGSLGRLSKRGIFEFILLYSAYLMTFYSIAMDVYAKK